MSNEPSIEPPYGVQETARTWDKEIAELANRQHGVVGRRQLLEMGIGRRSLAGRLDRGSLHELHRGVYAVGHTVISLRGRWMAAVLAAGPDAVLSHRAAGCLWGVIGSGSGPIDVTRPGGPRARRPGISGHESTFADDEIGHELGIPVTSPARTLLDLAAVLPRHRLEAAMNEAEVLRLHDRVSLPQLLERHPGRRGAANLRGLLAATPVGVTRNDFESAFLALVDSARLPRPRLNADLMLRGRFFEIDCLWRRERLAVELDGRAVHGTRRAFERDRERDRILLAEGWRPTRVTWRQLQDEPRTVARDLRCLLGRAVD